MTSRIPFLEPGAGSKAHPIREGALDLTALARERITEWNQAVREFTSQKPALALGLAAGMGVMLGWLIKRR